MNIGWWTGMACLASWGLPATAAPPDAAAAAASRPTLSLTATGQIETAVDRLTVILKATREGADAASVQMALKQALDGALRAAKGEVARPADVETHTGNFNLSPRFAKPGTIAGWVGTAELVIEGSDLPAVASLAGAVPTMTVDRVAYTLSTGRRDDAADRATALAITRFRAQAAAFALSFGYGGYVLREADVSTSEGQVAPPRSLGLAKAMMAASDAPLPVESGNATVTAFVRGVVELTR